MSQLHYSLSNHIEFHLIFFIQKFQVNPFLLKKTQVHSFPPFNWKISRNFTNIFKPLEIIKVYWIYAAESIAENKFCFDEDQ